MTTKEKILKAALKLFAKQGIDKTSTAQITKEVGVSEGALFVHFKTKQVLIDTLYLEIKKAAFLNIDNIIGPKQSVEKNVKATSKHIIEYFVEHYDEFVFMELIENDPQVSKATMLKAVKYYKGLVQAFTEWEDKGKLKKLGKEELKGVLWNLIMVFIRSTKAGKAKRVDPKHLDVIWDAVKR